jgi:hypothetical protein
MSEHQWGQAPTAPQPPQWGQAPPPSPPRKRWSTARIVTVVLAGFAGLLLLTVAVAVAVVATNQPATKPATRAATPTIQAAAAPAATEPPAPSYPEPKKSDFTLRAKVIKLDRFGSAGNLITYKVEAGWGPTYDPDKTYELVYEVRGGEDGPVTNYMNITGDKYEQPSEETISTRPGVEKLRISVISVDEA